MVLFLLQFACFIFMLINASFLALIRIGGFHPHFTGKRQESICHDDKVAYRPLIIC